MRHASNDFLDVVRLLGIGLWLLASSGCVSVPSQLKDTGASLLPECSSGTDSKKEIGGAMLVSVEVDLLTSEAWYFLLTDTDKDLKFLMILDPRVVSAPENNGDSRHVSLARVYCYELAPGSYRFGKAFGSTRISNAGGHSFRSYVFEKEVRVRPNSILYLGRFVIEDPRLKGKDYFARTGTAASAMISGIFTGTRLPDNIEISVADRAVEDRKWLEENQSRLRTWPFFDLAQ